MQRGQVLSKAFKMARRMNSERFRIPPMAFAKDSSTLKVMTSSFRDPLTTASSAF
jgi:hypothetical protein